MRYLLDTNILSDAIKNPQGKVAKRILNYKNNEIFTSIVVAAEMRFGVQKKGSPVLAQRVDLLLGALPVMPLDHDADVHYGQLRTRLERSGKIIGANDMLIAAHALALDAVLVTDNVNEFERVENLRVENWLL